MFLSFVLIFNLPKNAAEHLKALDFGSSLLPLKNISGEDANVLRSNQAGMNDCSPGSCSCYLEREKILELNQAH